MAACVALVSASAKHVYFSEKLRSLGYRNNHARSKWARSAEVKTPADRKRRTGSTTLKPVLITLRLRPTPRLLLLRVGAGVPVHNQSFFRLRCRTTASHGLLTGRRMCRAHSRLRVRLLARMRLSPRTLASILIPFSTYFLRRRAPRHHRIMHAVRTDKADMAISIAVENRSRLPTPHLWSTHLRLTTRWPSTSAQTLLTSRT
jgi:hypothetical protein